MSTKGKEKNKMIDTEFIWLYVMDYMDDNDMQVDDFDVATVVNELFFAALRDGVSVECCEDCGLLPTAVVEDAFTAGKID